MKKEIKEVLNFELSEFDPEFSFSEEKLFIFIENGVKKVEITWPFPTMEIYFDLWESGKKIFSESYEYYEQESHKEVAEDVARFAARFLRFEVRVEKVGKVLTHNELQINENGNWVSFNE